MLRPVIKYSGGIFWVVGRITVGPNMMPLSSPASLLSELLLVWLNWQEQPRWKTLFPSPWGCLLPLFFVILYLLHASHQEKLKGQRRVDLLLSCILCHLQTYHFFWSVWGLLCCCFSLESCFWSISPGMYLICIFVCIVKWYWIAWVL